MKAPIEDLVDRFQETTREVQQCHWNLKSAEASKKQAQDALLKALVEEATKET